MHQTRCAGTTLVEVILAIAVLAVLAIGGMSAISYSQSGINVQRTKRAAIDAANHRLEEMMRGVPYATVAGMVGSSATNTITLNGVGGYARVTTVTPGGVTGENLLKITVRVQYRRNGDSVQLETYRSK